MVDEEQDEEDEKEGQENEEEEEEKKEDKQEVECEEDKKKVDVEDEERGMSKIWRGSYWKKKKKEITILLNQLYTPAFHYSCFSLTYAQLFILIMIVLIPSFT